MGCFTYNGGMNHLTLVLPFALPPPELAADLVRALTTPALAALLSRTSRDAMATFDDDARALPHELWLARTLKLSQTQATFAAPAMRGLNIPSGPDWLMVNPAHIEIARSHLALHDLRKLQLTDADSRALFDSALPLFTELGHALVYGDAQTWFLQADGWDALETASPDTVLGMNLSDMMPAGDKARDFRRLQNEVQMLWFEHPVNTARAARGLPAVNAIWPWGAGAAPGDTVLAVSGAPAWLQAMASHTLSDPGQILTQDGDALLLCDTLTGPGLGGEWSRWIDAMHMLEQQLFAPALALLAAGRVKSIRMVLTRRTALLDITTTSMAQRKFWRRPTLDHFI